MSTTARIGAFVVALVVVFGIAFAIGGAVDPIGQDPAPSEQAPEAPEEHEEPDDHGSHP